MTGELTGRLWITWRAGKLQLELGVLWSMPSRQTELEINIHIKHPRVWRNTWEVQMSTWWIWVWKRKGMEDITDVIPLASPPANPSYAAPVPHPATPGRGDWEAMTTKTIAQSLTSRNNGERWKEPERQSYYVGKKGECPMNPFPPMWWLELG